MISSSTRSLPLALLGLFLVAGSPESLAADCYKSKDCAPFYTTNPTPTNLNPDFCRVETKAALEDKKANTNTNAFERPQNPTLCGVMQHFDKVKQNYLDVVDPDPLNLLGELLQCGRYIKSKECAGL